MKNRDLFYHWGTLLFVCFDVFKFVCVSLIKDVVLSGPKIPKMGHDNLSC